MSVGNQIVVLLRPIEESKHLAGIGHKLYLIRVALELLQSEDNLVERLLLS